MKIRIKEHSLIARLAAWKLHSSRMAITLGRTIYLHNTTRAQFLEDKTWVCHELVHVRQFRQYGFLPFLVRYCRESLKKGYYNNRWEAEARALESNHNLLQGVQFC